MAIPQSVIDRLGQSVQPLVFETGTEEFPYSTKGTVFLVGYKGRSYVLTARHALNVESLVPICVFPSDTSQQLIPLNDVFYVPRSDEDEDFVDLAVIAIDTHRITHADTAQAQLIDLGKAAGEWKQWARESPLFVIGYPEEHSSIDELTQMIRTDRFVLLGKYGGPSSEYYLHVLEMTDAKGLSTFSGFSGGPVFAWVNRPNERPIPMLCGMALRGTPQSGLIHFLDCEVLIDALKAKRRLELR